ncbi:MAG: RNA polymerase sigma factor [Clostridium sp.]|nr:RNA polymerase sigma factor [Clostridium sp.]
MDFDSIYQSYFKDVYLYVLGMSHNKNIAEEITQETFVKAMKAIDSFDGRKDIRAWLFTIAKNTYFTYCKRQNIFTGHPPDENTEALETPIVNIISNEETAFQIHRFLHNMREPYKEIFTLRIFGELPYEQIGLLFGKSGNWARVIYYRAKKQIIEHIGGKQDE